MAEFLNDWSAGFADRTPDCLHSATFYPEPGAADYVAARIAAGAEIFKVHVQVGAFDVRDPLLAEAWGVLEDAGTPVVIHAGSGPVGTPYTGPGPVADLLRAYPRLALVIAHLGAPEYAEFVTLAETYERVCVDTTMVFTDFFDDLGAAFPPTWCRACATCSRRCCSARTSRTSPTPTASSWPASRGSTSATTGSARSAGRTASASSGTLARTECGIVLRAG